jgi:hypothetical protein
MDFRYLLKRYFNFSKVFCFLLLSSCGAGRELSFDEFNTISDQDMWLGIDERVLPPLYEDEYVIGKKDSLKITVQDHDEFDTAVKVNLKGEIRLPLVEEPLLITGLTLEQAEESICHFLSPYVRNDVNCELELIASGSRFYYLMGNGFSSFVTSSGGASGDVGNQFTVSSASLRKVSMGVEPVYVRDILLAFLEETNLEEVTIIRPDLTDRKRPHFMTIDMSGIPRAQWNKNYRIRPNDIVVVKQTFVEELKDMIDIFTEEVNDLDRSDQDFEHMMRFLEARLGSNQAKKDRHSGGR